MTNPLVGKTDADLLASKSAIDEFVNNTGGSLARIQQLRDQLPGYFQSDATRPYIGKIDNWVNNYTALRQQFQQIGDGIGQTNNTVNRHVDTATGLANGVSTDFYTGLTGQ